MARYDLELLKERTDLPALFSELVGTVRSEGAAWRAPCPAPEHGPQTGKTPPVSIEPTGRLWRCHACGAAGSAIDLVMHNQGLTKAAAIELLAHRAGLSERPPDLLGTRPERVTAPAKATPPATAPQGDTAALEAYVAGCEAALWSQVGEEALAWLHGRGLVDDVLRANRVGVDPGKTALPRAEGLPTGNGPGVVFPVLDQGRPVYLQLRTTGRSSAKYVNPATAQWGANVRVAVVDGPATTDTVLVCEGMPDALTAAGAGYRAAAVLGTEAPDADVARRLVEAFPTGPLVLALDGDPAGARSTATLTSLLQSAGAGRRVYRLDIPQEVAADPKDRDLNGWLLAATSDFPAQLAGAVEAAAPAGWKPVISAADLLPAFLAKLARPDEAIGIPTGIETLDRYLANGGWRPGLVLLGGLPGIGKSAFCFQAALHAAGRDHPVLYVSVEQSEEEFLGRLFCRELGKPVADFWNRAPAYLDGARSIVDRLPLDRLYLRADPLIRGEDHDGTVGRVRRWTEEILDVTGAKPLVVVDYLQRMRPAEPDRRLDERLRISSSGGALRQLARDLEVPVVVVSSIGRNSYEGLPSLNWFKGSGDLEYDADACVILTPATEIARAVTLPVDLHIVKNRYGALTFEKPVRLTYDRGFGSFRDATPAATNSGPIPQHLVANGRG